MAKAGSEEGGSEMRVLARPHEDIYQEFTCRIRLYSNYYDIRRDTTINDFCIRSQPYTVDYVCFVYDCVPSIFV